MRTTPISRPARRSRRGEAVDGIEIRDLPGGHGVALLHKGPYEELGRSYVRIVQCVKDHGYEVVMPTREVYIKGPGMILRGNPKKYLTEIQFLVRQQRRPRGGDP